MRLQRDAVKHGAPEACRWINMKTSRKILTALTLTLIVYVIMVPARSDKRLLGSYMFDGVATHERWKPFPDITQQDTFNILGQIFGEQPVTFTDRLFTMEPYSGTLTNRYWVLWRSDQGALIYDSPVTFFRINYTEDGMWMKIVPRREQMLHVKMIKTPQMIQHAPPAGRGEAPRP